MINEHLKGEFIKDLKDKLFYVGVEYNNDTRDYETVITPFDEKLIKGELSELEERINTLRQKRETLTRLLK